MRQIIYNRKGNVKGLLFIIGILLIVSGIFYSHKLVNNLKEKSTEYVRFRIKVFETNINNPNLNADINFLFNDVIRGADYPMIYTDTNRQPQSWKNLSDRLEDKPFSDFSSADSSLLFSYLEEMVTENQPIPIKYREDIVLGYFYYGYSPVIYKLRLFPYIAIGAGALFVLIGYFGFSYIKNTEQQLIWVGMAKETAHQLGTPLSSIAGWMELLRLDSSNLETSIEEVHKDLTRLNKIASRFSKIGSVPALTAHDLHKTINSVVEYFRRRLPNMQKKVSISFKSAENSSLVLLNQDVFEWVLENLIKNSLDAIEKKSGRIELIVSKNLDKKQVYLDIKDNGRGVLPQNKKNIFKPGFSTKPRGWGLGLSLARRIVVDYHGGKLFLKESRPGVGSTFRIVLSTAHAIPTDSADV